MTNAAERAPFVSEAMAGRGQGKEIIKKKWRLLYFQYIELAAIILN
jgi:hypothetical protein